MLCFLRWCVRVQQQAWAWVFFFGTMVMAAFMAKDVVSVLLVLPKTRAITTSGGKPGAKQSAESSSKCAFESMDTVFILLAISLVIIVVQAGFTLARSLGAGPKGGNCWTPYVCVRRRLCCCFDSRRLCKSGATLLFARCFASP